MAFKGFVEVFAPKDGPTQPSSDVIKAENHFIKSRQKPDIARLSLESQLLPSRPAYGTKGTPISLRTNYFDIRLADPNVKLYRYQVEVDPAKGAARKRRQAFQLLLKEADCLKGVRPAVASDNRSILVSAKKLQLEPGQSVVEGVTYHDPEQKGPAAPATQQARAPDIYKFKITCPVDASVAEISLGNLMNYLRSASDSMSMDEKSSIIQLLNIAMARKPASTPLEMAVSPQMNKFYPLGGNIMPDDLGGGLIALKGYFTSVRTSTLRLLLNINTVTSAFYRPGCLLSLMKDFRTTLKAPNDTIRNYQIHLFLKNLRVRYDNKTKVIAGLFGPRRDQNALTARFMRDGNQISVADFFKQQHKVTLIAPEEPVVNLGNAQNPVLIPPELCEVLPGQIARRKLSADQTTTMLRVASRKPHTNADLIVGEGVRVIGLSPQSSDGPGIFGLNVDPHMLVVPGRILPVPPITYHRSGRNSNLNPRDGSWNMIDVKFSTGATVPQWSYVQLKAEDDPRLTLRGQPKDVLQPFVETLRRHGMNAELPRPQAGYGNPSFPRSSHTEYLRRLDGLFKKAQGDGVRALLFLNSSKSPALYAAIKYLGDVKYGIHTSQVLVEKLNKYLQQSDHKGLLPYLANVALKWNVRFGGVNQQVPATEQSVSGKPNILASASKTMLVGIDVTHPSPGSKEEAPSVAGVVASIDAQYTQYPASLRCQESRKEMVTDLKPMMIERLRAWQSNNSSHLPSHILIYRDGVSEGQFKRVLEEEAPLVDAAIQAVYPPNAAKPKVSIVVVGKRHHTRFYPMKPTEAHKSGNPRNGTVVDRGITSERQWDFFLQAHTGLQGTARPAHYTVLQDQIGLGADGLESLTHNLSYLYARATKSVSICPPAYYADLVCDRARCYLYETYVPEPVSASAAETVYDPSAGWREGVHGALEGNMFYV